MPAPILKPQKRVLGDSIKTHANSNILPSPSDAKRRKLDLGSSPSKPKLNRNSVNKKLGSSQPKSQFVEEVLEKLTQDINGLKQNNAEKDQKWDRPGLEDFDPSQDSLCFQQIEVEEGTLHGGQATIKLFGVTEVGAPCQKCHALTSQVDWPFSPTPCHRLSPLPVSRSPCLFCQLRLQSIQILPRNTDGAECDSYRISTHGDAREFVWLSRESAKPISQDHCYGP